MKKLVRSWMVFVTVLLCAVEICATQQFTVNGEIRSDVMILSNASEGRATPIPEDMDWSSVRIVVAQTIVDSEGELKVVELASGQFEDRSIHLTGEVVEPIDAQISLVVDKTELATLDALLSPGSTVSFVVNENFAHLELLGNARNVRDSSKKFTIYSDFSFNEGNLDGAVVRVRAGEYDATGERRGLVYGRAILDEGKFVIEAEVDEPRVVNILLIASAQMGYDQTHAVIEPGAKIRVSSLGTSTLQGMYATSNKGNHAQLIDAWQQSEEYLSIFRSYVSAYEEYQHRMQSGTESSSVDSSNDDSIAGAAKAAEQATPTHFELSRQLNRLRYDFLDEVASTAEDPMSVLLALELGAYRGDEEALSIYDKLANSLDHELVFRRVTQARNSHASRLARAGIDKSLTIGKQAPDFVLPNLEGEEIELSNLLAKRDFVLVDFWASWCAPCIATLPALKELYSDYHDLGFEIVSIAIDDNHEMWSEGTEMHEPTWINLGELEGFQGEVAASYGVTFIPKAYLLDSQGQIVQKDLSTDQLKDFLAKEYSEAAESIIP